MSELKSSLPSGGSGELSLNALSGADKGAFHLAAEAQLSNHADIAAARQFFQPAPAGGTAPFLGSGAEAGIAAGKAVAAASGAEASAVAAAAKSIAAAAGEAAALGAHAVAGVAGAGAVAGAEVSPMIQLIMRLPGLGGVAQSFFEWLGALFSAPGQLAEVFNPNMWSHLAGSVHSSLGNISAHGISAEHFQVPVSMLPANAPFLHQLSLQSGNGFAEMQRLTGESTLNNSGLSELSLQNRFNISGPIDLKKPQFEMGGVQSSGAALRLDGKIAGTHLSEGTGNSALSGTQRIFADNISGQQSLFAQSSSPVSNPSFSNTPASGNGSLNISSSAFGQSGPEGMINSAGLSGSGNAGYQLSDAAGSTLDRSSSLSPSGAVSDTLGGRELLAANNVQGSNGIFHPPADASMKDFSTGTGAEPESAITGLKAEPMSLLKKVQSSGSRTHEFGVSDQISHQSGAGSHPSASAQHTKPVMDQISHRGGHTGESHLRHASAKSAAAQARQTASGAGQNSQAWKNSPSGETQISDQSLNPEQSALSNAGSDNNIYSVQRGDNLWDIARKQLGDATRWQEIYKLNSELIGNNPDLIHTGIELKLPGMDATQISDAGNYTVQPGDNLWDIARERLGDGSRWGELYHANEAVIGENPRLILPGQQLQMPGAQAELAQSAPAQAGVAVDPSGAAAQAMTPQAVYPQTIAPQTMAPQGPAPEAMAPHAMAPQPMPQSVISQAPVQYGPGAAAAATLDSTQMLAENHTVSPSLAPDLSFLTGNNKSQ